jgi:hypothetical protein
MESSSRIAAIKTTAPSPQLMQKGPAAAPATTGHPIRCLTGLDFLQLVGLEDVADLEVLVVLQGDAALVAFGYLYQILLQLMNY